MNEENKQPLEEEEQAPEAQAQEAQQPQAEAAAEGEKEEKNAKAKKKKEKGITFTREQVEQMELAAKQLESVKDQFVRLTAEYDNYRKRTAKEKEAIYPEAKASTLASMLPVLDNFERAMAAPCSDADFKKGMELIRKAFDELLEKQGVEAFGEVGDPFDPQLHAAVAHTDDESAGENCIAEVFQKGYRMGDRVLRYAMVKVAN